MCWSEEKLNHVIKTDGVKLFKDLLREDEFIWNKDFCGVFQCYAFSLCHNIWMKKFFQVELLNWFIKSSKFEEVFNDDEQLWSFSRYFYKCLHCRPDSFGSLLRSWKEKLCCNNLNNTRIYHGYEDTCDLTNKVCYI